MRNTSLCETDCLVRAYFSPHYRGEKNKTFWFLTLSTFWLDLITLVLLSVKIIHLKCNSILQNSSSNKPLIFLLLFPYQLSSSRKYLEFQNYPKNRNFGFLTSSTAYQVCISRVLSAPIASRPGSWKFEKFLTGRTNSSVHDLLLCWSSSAINALLRFPANLSA